MRRFLICATLAVMVAPLAPGVTLALLILRARDERRGML